ncbi:MAG TPA: hypothetical protein VF530_22175 [Planctomycetota bacterium]
MTTHPPGGGARLARRSLLAGCAALGLAPRLAARLGARGDAFELSFDEFLAEAVPLAHDLVGDTSRTGQDRYLHALAALAAALRDVPVPEMRETTAMGAAGRTFLGANECDAPFTVLHWRLEPGARIGLHPHIYGNVVTVCLAGEVRIENYEVLGAPDFDTRDPFRVRRTNDQVLTPRNVNLLNLEHGYVHGFVAGPEGARGLDLTTRIKPKRSTPTLVVGAAAEPARAVFEASWKHA